MKKFWTKIDRAAGRYTVTVLSHEIDTTCAPSNNGYPASKQQVVETRCFATKRAALVWAIVQPATREMALSSND